MTAVQTLVDDLARLDRLVDAAAWQEADRLMREHALGVHAFFAGRPHDDAGRRALLDAQRALSLKFAALREEAAQGLADLRRGHAAAQRYLAGAGP